MTTDPTPPTPADSGGWFGNILSTVNGLGQTATGVIGAIKGGSKSPTPNTKPVVATAGMSTQTILLIAAGGLTVLLVVMMFLRGKK